MKDGVRVRFRCGKSKASRIKHGSVGVCTHDDLDRRGDRVSLKMSWCNEATQTQTS